MTTNHTPFGTHAIALLCDEIGKEHSPALYGTRRFGRVGIIGAGSMGIGIAMGLLDADIPVTLFDKREALDRGLALLRSAYAQQFMLGALPADGRDRRLALFNATPRFHHLKDSDLVLDLMPAETDAREKFFRWLDEIGKPDALLVTHAAGDRLERIARLTRRPADVLGLEVSDPDELCGQVTLVRARESAGHSVEAARALLGMIGKLKA